MAVLLAAAPPFERPFSKFRYIRAATGPQMAATAGEAKN